MSGAPSARPGCAVIVFAKAPIAGYAKTRLAPVLGAAGAARLAERMLAHAVRQAVAARIGPVELCVAPDSSHPAFGSLAASYAVALTEQGPGDLGLRMHRAFARRLAAGATPPVTRALLIGTDAPALDAAMLRRACAALGGEPGDSDEGDGESTGNGITGHATHTDAVFVPALDGGYALVGLRAPAPQLFDGIAWSTPTVMARTRERLALLGLRYTELPAVADIDEPADMAHVPAGWVE